MNFNRWLIGLFILIGVVLGGCAKPHTTSEGYVEGEYRYISANYAGVLQKLAVARGSQIKQRQLLFMLDPQPESDAQKQVEQQVQQYAAGLALAQQELKRQQVLYRKSATDKDSLDKARTTYLQAQANLKNAQAALSQAQWIHQQKTIIAPVSALVFDTYYLPGELVPAGYPVLSLLAPADVKIIFYINETQLSKLKLGQAVQISCDHCQQILVAKITFISPQAEYTPPVIYSNDVRAKLVYRIEARPDLADAQKLHPGQPVDVLW
jgi:HlyD family secretion protein